MPTATIGTDLSVAETYLRRGQLVGLPTETVYGLAGNALDPLAVARIFKTKERPAFDPLIMHLPSLEAAEIYVLNIPDLARKLAASYWPGPLTMVFKRRSLVPDLVTSGLDTVAIRVPRHPLALALLERLDFPLAAPSANPFGYISPTRPEHVRQQLGEKIPYILDGGPCTIGLESSIISFASAEPVLLRKGGLAIEDIFATLGTTIKVNTRSSSNPIAPGMLVSHYAPRTPLSLLSKEDLATSLVHENKIKPGKIAHLVFGGDREFRDDDRVFDLSPTADLTEAASNLFATLRQLDELDCQEIRTALLPEIGLGRAINDRLRRAAANVQ